MIQGQDQTDLKNSLENIQKTDWYLSKIITSNYTILDNDKIKTIIVGDIDADVTITFPTISENIDRIIEIRNNNSYTYRGSNNNSRKIIIDGEDAETFDYLGIQQTTIDIEVINTGIRLKNNGTSWDIYDIFGAEILDINGTLEMCYKKYFTGTTDNDGQTAIAHGVTYTKIIQICGFISNTGIPGYVVYDYLSINAAASAYYFYFNSTNIYFEGVGAQLQGKNYKIQIQYYI